MAARHVRTGELIFADSAAREKWVSVIKDETVLVQLTAATTGPLSLGEQPHHGSLAAVGDVVEVPYYYAVMDDEDASHNEVSSFFLTRPPPGQLS